MKFSQQVTVFKSLLYVFFYLTVSDISAKGYCVFPESLWRSASGLPDKLWYTDIEYFDDPDIGWRSRHVVSVKMTEILIKQEVKVPCAGRHLRDTTVTCLQEDVVMTLTCLSEEPNSKFRVQERNEKKR